MENINKRHYESIRKALEGVGLAVDKIQKKRKKTVITVLCNEKSYEIATLEEQVAKEKTREVKEWKSTEVFG
jgi:vacuolar-type H+-ATPase subunit F/Vma7